MLVVEIARVHRALEPPSIKLQVRIPVFEDAYFRQELMQVLDLRVFAVAVERLMLDRRLAVSQASENLPHMRVTEPDHRAHGSRLRDDRLVEGSELLAQVSGPVVQENR
ncbi:hypothetical protein G352_19081 [Rhodococcus ruber BKS 20-38]|uniref:Uncharacterized protein n=1 Tax=Rhodococcus ruber BKS 20-38 TaxID=1278076 RepID=M2ZK42_9NOCA|nr:hypothetical protein G352_19081 [Rhodococcus ruber BKS 20-38]